MKKIVKKISLVFLVAVLQTPFALKAQIDTAFLQNEYTSQYIFPPMLDPIGYPSREIPNTFEYTVSNSSFALMYDENGRGVVKIAQRYEIEEDVDSVSLIGTAFLISSWQQSGYNTIKVGIWDTNLTTEIYAQEFIISAENLNDVFYGRVDLDPWIECIFDDTIVLYEDYYVALESYSTVHTPATHYKIPSLILEDYCASTDNFDAYCTPYGISTKYKPYVQFSDSRTWIYVDDVEWVDVYHNTYEGMVTNAYISDYYEVCDTVVYRPWGYCAIKVAEDTTSSSLMSVRLTEENVELYPNPATDELNISCDYNILEVEVFDALNRFIYKQKSNSKNTKLNVSAYKSGTYILRIKTDKGKIDKKFIVN